MHRIATFATLSTIAVTLLFSTGCSDPAKVQNPPDKTQRINFDGAVLEETPLRRIKWGREEGTLIEKKVLDLGPNQPRLNPFLVYPQFAEAKSLPLGVLELTFGKFTDRAPKVDEEQSIEVAAQTGSKPLALEQDKVQYHVFELKAYRPNGDQLTRDQLLETFQQPGVVLATLAPASPPKQYLEALSDSAIVLEVPYEPSIRVAAPAHESAK